MLPFFFSSRRNHLASGCRRTHVRNTDDAKLFTPIVEPRIHPSTEKERRKKKTWRFFTFETVTPKFPPLLFLIVYQERVHPSLLPFSFFFSIYIYIYYISITHIVILKPEQSNKRANREANPTLGSMKAIYLMNASGRTMRSRWCDSMQPVQSLFFFSFFLSLSQLAPPFTPLSFVPRRSAMLRVSKVEDRSIQTATKSCAFLKSKSNRAVRRKQGENPCFETRELRARH